MSPHTPGPWSTTFARDLPNDPRFDIIAYGARPFPNASPAIRTIATDVSQADAPLIAAAPALLEAVRLMLNMAARPDGLGGVLYVDKIGAFATARAALAQAEGKDTP